MPSPNHVVARQAKRGKTQGQSSTSLSVLRARMFTDVPWLVHGFSTRQGGVSKCYGGKTLNLGLTQHDEASNVERNRELFVSAVGATDATGCSWPLVQVKQIHSGLVQ